MYATCADEEVVFTAGGRRARNAARIALVILLFGSLCGCLGVIGETSTRAIELWTHWRKSAWLATTRIGRTLVLCTEVVLVVLPLSLASLVELPVVSFAGVAMMVAVGTGVAAGNASILGCGGVGQSRVRTFCEFTRTAG